MLTTAVVEGGKVVKINTWICFKSDVEQGGRLEEILSNGKVLVLVNKRGFEGDYIGGQTRTQVAACDCWVE